MSEHVSLRLALLDKQIVDRERLPIGRVDDLELVLPGSGGAPQTEAILTGAQALGDRLGGFLGGWMAAVAGRLRARSAGTGPSRIDPALVAELEPFVRLSVRFDDLSDVAGLERWLARNVVGPLPGAVMRRVSCSPRRSSTLRVGGSARSATFASAAKGFASSAWSSAKGRSRGSLTGGATPRDARAGPPSSPRLAAARFGEPASSLPSPFATGVPASSAWASTVPTFRRSPRSFAVERDRGTARRLGASRAPRCRHRRAHRPAPTLTPDEASRLAGAAVR